MNADRLFNVGEPTPRERADRRARNLSGQISLLELDPTPAPSCPVCSGEHGADLCQHGEALELAAATETTIKETR